MNERSSSPQQEADSFEIFLNGIKPQVAIRQTDCRQQAKVFMKMGDYLMAISRLSEAIAADPDHHWLYAERSFCHLMLGKKHEAEADMTMAEEMEQIVSSRKQAAYLMDQRKYSEAIRVLSEIIPISAPHAAHHISFLIERGICYEMLADYGNALQDAESLVSNYAGHAVGHIRKGLVLGRGFALYAQAEESLRTAIDISPHLLEKLLLKEIDQMRFRSIQLDHSLEASGYASLMSSRCQSRTLPLSPALSLPEPPVACELQPTWAVEEFGGRDQVLDAPAASGPASFERIYSGVQQQLPSAPDSEDSDSSSMSTTYADEGIEMIGSAEVSPTSAKSGDTQHESTPVMLWCSDFEKMLECKQFPLKAARMVHDAKKHSKSLIDKWQQANDETEADDVRSVINELNFAIQLDASDYLLFINRGYCYEILSMLDYALEDTQVALTKIPSKNRQTFAKVHMRKAHISEKSGLRQEAIQSVEEALVWNRKETYRLLCRGEVQVYLRYAACIGLNIGPAELAREAACSFDSIKRTLRYAVQHSSHFDRLVNSPYRRNNHKVDRGLQENDAFLDSVIGRILEELSPNSQLLDWFQDLETENQSNWTSLYIKNVTKNCKQDLQARLSLFGSTECNVKSGAEPGTECMFMYSLNRFDNWISPILAMAALQGKLLQDISPAEGPGLEVRPKRKESAPVTIKSVKDRGASIEFQRILASGPTGEDDVLISQEDQHIVRLGLKKLKSLAEVAGLTVKKLDDGFDAKKNQEHADKSEEKGYNVYRLAGQTQVLEAALKPCHITIVANRDCLVALAKTDWEERVKICSYQYESNGYIVIHLKRGFPDEYVDGSRKRDTGTTKQEYRGNRYQELNYVTTRSGKVKTRDFLTLNEVILRISGVHEVYMWVCTEIDGELDGDLCEIKYKDSAIDDEKKADWCLFSKLAGHNLKLRIGVRHGNTIRSRDETVSQLLEDVNVKAIYERKVNLLCDNVLKLIHNSKTSRVYVADLGSLNPDYYKVLGDVEKYSYLYGNKPLIPNDLLKQLDDFVRRSRHSCASE